MSLIIAFLSVGNSLQLVKQNAMRGGYFSSFGSWKWWKINFQTWKEKKTMEYFLAVWNCVSNIILITKLLAKKRKFTQLRIKTLGAAKRWLIVRNFLVPRICLALSQTVFVVSPNISFQFEQIIWFNQSS